MYTQYLWPISPINPICLMQCFYRPLSLVYAWMSKSTWVSVVGSRFRARGAVTDIVPWCSFCGVWCRYEMCMSGELQNHFCCCWQTAVFAVSCGSGNMNSFCTVSCKIRYRSKFHWSNSHANWPTGSVMRPVGWCGGWSIEWTRRMNCRDGWPRCWHTDIKFHSLNM